MRFHGRLPLLQLWNEVADARALMCADFLTVARYEPAVAFGVQAAAFLDLVFSNGSRTAVLPNIEVASGMLLERERTPLIWPAAARNLGYAVLDALETLVVPWLESRTLARQSNDELVHRFSSAIAEDRFEAARAAHFIGASPYRECMASFAPYVYAIRFCRNDDVGIADPKGGSGAALLARRSRVQADLADAALNELAAEWFSRSIFGGVDDACAVGISTGDRALRGSRVTISLDSPAAAARVVQVASPVPSDVMVSFDPEDAPPVRSFGVEVCDEVQHRVTAALHDTPVSGGSSGRILMLMREDFERAVDADNDEARALADRLRAEGFTVDLAAATTLKDDVQADLVHAFGVRALSEGSALVERLRGRGVPVVTTPGIPRIPQEASWGPQVLRAILTRSTDDAVLDERFELLERRRLSTDDAAMSQAPSLASTADVAVVSCEAEALHLRERYGFTGEIVRSAPYLHGIDGPAASIAAITGVAPFVFVHAPLEWRSDIVLLVKAASALGMPVVVAGPTIDVDLLRNARSLAPELFIHFPHPTPEELAALYRTARVFTDVSWSPSGQYRVARALASGCAVVASRSSYAVDTWPEAVLEADPGSVASMTSALEKAWQGAAPPVPIDASAAFSAAILAYATAQRVREPA